jgi:hypothetical protein
VPLGFFSLDQVFLECTIPSTVSVPETQYLSLEKFLIVAKVAPIFGIPHPTSSEVLFYPGLAGRNFAAGLAVLSIGLNGHRKALGILLMCWSFVGLADTYVLMAHPEGNNHALHLFNVVWVSLTGLGLAFSG